MCGYFDAQIAWPERFVMALCDDARRAALQFGSSCEIYTHTTVAWRREQIELTDRQGIKLDRFAPAAIVNATGAWVDHTLAQLQVESLRLMAGTKGTHLVIDAPAIREWLGGDGLYIEASDGRPVFVLPWEDYTLVGTTDLPFTGDPRDAVADPDEIEYLLAAVNRVLPQGSLGTGDVLAHYCGVRPLPAARGGSTAAVTRRHWLETHVDAPLPFYSIIGGKLTTCRSLAESTCDTILKQLQIRKRHATEREMFGGSRGYPPDLTSLETQQRCLADEFGHTQATVRAIWRLFGTATSHVLAESTSYADDRLVANTELPRGVVRWVIAHEGVETLDDLVARRLLLVYDRRLTRRTLVELAELLSLTESCPRATSMLRQIVKRPRSTVAMVAYCGRLRELGRLVSCHLRNTWPTSRSRTSFGVVTGAQLLANRLYASRSPFFLSGPHSMAKNRQHHHGGKRQSQQRFAPRHSPSPPRLTSPSQSCNTASHSCCSRTPRRTRSSTPAGPGSRSIATLPSANGSVSSKRCHKRSTR